MGILLSKNLRQKQSVTLTPTLKKSIDLLQLSRFELIKKIEKLSKASFFQNPLGRLKNKRNLVNIIFN